MITVPTPINRFKAPDLSPLLRASEMTGKVLNKSDIVIYESTVYPGCTEEDCVPVLERYSGLKFNTDFFCRYSPEIINPGDWVNMLTGYPVKWENVLILGFAFKENCPDIRNTRVIDIYEELHRFGMDVTVFDPWADPGLVLKEYGFELDNVLIDKNYKAIIVAVSHQEFLTLDYKKYKASGAIIFNTKSFIERKYIDARL